ncbi:MAG: SMC family ATPase [Desulfurellaceae bacterium]|nr:SMC family ATPase [Desulfurellaceae bacterium]
MRPQKLSLKNFMPFRVTGDQVHEVDFSQLDLFSITGPMASGKSALIDAMVWCLYGRTARYGADSKGVISAGEQTCEVVLDFSLGERWFRAVRRTGKMTESGLSEREGEEWIQDTSGSALLTKRIEDILGLDFDSFTKTVILPQGRYAEFLTSEPSKRRELLAKILELGVYGRVREQARDVARQAETRAATLRETLAQYAGLSQERIALQKEELETLVQGIEQVSQQETLLQSVAQQVDQVASLRSRLAELQSEVQARSQEKEQAQTKAEEASAQVAELAQELAQIRQEREALGYDAARHEVVERATEHLTAWMIAQTEAERKKTERTAVQKEVDTLIQQVAASTRQVEQARTQQQSHSATFEQLVAEAGDVTTLTEKLGAARRWKELQQEHRQLASRIEALRQDHTATQHRLDDLKRKDASHEQTVRALQDKLEGAKEDERQKRQLIAEAERLGREWQEAAEAEERARDELETARTELTRTEGAAQQARQTLAQAEEQEQVARTALEDSQRQHEAAHLQATLQLGDPCPVCQTTVSRLPAAQEVGDDLKMLQTQMERAARVARQKRTEAQEANTTLATRRARREAAEQGLKERERLRQKAQNSFGSRFPDSASPSAVIQAIQIQQEELSLALRDMEAQSVSAEQEKARLSGQREETQHEAARLGGELRGTAERLEADTRELEVLGREIAAFLTPNGDPEQSVAQRRTAVMQAEQQLKEAEKALRQLESTLNSLNTSQVQKDGALNLLAAEYEGALLRAEREARTVRARLGLAEDAPLPHIEDVEDELKALSDKQTRHADLLRREENARARRERAEGQAKESHADLHARTRVLDEARGKQRQAQHGLEHEREKLREMIVQHQLTDAGEDGQNIRLQLETARGQRMSLREQRGRLEAEQAEAERRWQEKEQEEDKLRAAETEQRLASDLRKLLGAEFTDFLSRGAIHALMHDASRHLQGLTHGRYTFDIASRGRAINLQIVDHENQRLARPTHSLSGGETFLASLAIALALSQGFRAVATGRAAKTSTECLILDEGFGTLDREGVQMVTETLQELRGEEGRMVGIITHVEEVAAAMPMQIEVRKGSRSSAISVSS